MIQGFYTAASGTLAHQSSIDISANNLANINTFGFKGQRAAFYDLLYTNLSGPDGQAPQNLKQGSGVRVFSADNIMMQGGLVETGRPLDAGIIGNGFFAVRDSDGNQYYTRCGNFQASVNADGNTYLTTAEGDFVLDSELKPIVLKGSAGDVIYGQDGVMPGVFSFANPYALDRVGDTKFSANAYTGQPVLSDDSEVYQGRLENSTVDITEEMAKVIAAQRGFQFNAKLIQVADEMEQMANNLRS